MNKITFRNHKELADFMHTNACYGITVYAVLFYKDAKKLLKKLISFDRTNILDIEINDSTYDGYDKEYYVIIDGEMNVSCEKAFHKKNKYHGEGYYNFGNDGILTLIDGDANSLIIKSAEGSICFEYEINKHNDDVIECIEKLINYFLEE